VEVEEEVVEATERKGQFSLLVRLLSSKPFNQDAFKQTMLNRWRTSLGAQMKDLGNNLFIAIFNDAMDREIVLLNGPWSFDKSLVIMKPFDGEQKVNEVQMTEASFWIQIHDLPMKGMNEGVAERVEQALGVLEETEVLEDGITWGDFLRVKVRIDITKPLLRRKKLKLGKDDPIWVTLKYKKLPTYCYQCGILGHSERECREGVHKGQQCRRSDAAYGPWLRATLG
jgi:hypothetical protein